MLEKRRMDTVVCIQMDRDSGNKKLDKRPDQVGTEDALRGHNLALKLHEHGFRVNFTLMFEPFQTMLAMQARPYFINTFLRHRLLQSQNIKKCFHKKNTLSEL